MELPEETEVCVGGTRPRTFLKVQLELAMGLGMPTLGALTAFGWWWILIPILPLWAFCIYQTKRDPQCLTVWVTHCTLPTHLGT